MKQLITIALMLIAATAFGQVTKGSGILYFDSIPNVAPDTAFGAEIAVGIKAKKIYRWDRDSSDWQVLDVETNGAIQAIQVAVTDAGGFFSNSDVEEVLAEIATTKANIPDSVFVRNDSLFIHISGIDYYTGQKSNFVTPQMFGAVVNDSIDDSAAIQAAANSSSYVLLPPGRYDIHNEIFVGNQNGSPKYILGYGAILKRSNVVSDTLTVDAPTTQKFVVVANASQFNPGEEIIVLDPNGIHGGIGSRDHSSRLEIESISNDTIYLDTLLNTQFSNNIIPASYPSGSIVMKYFAMFSSSKASPVHLRGITFDGNAENNSLTFSWKGPATIEEMGEKSTIKNCIFQNAACENIFHEGDIEISGNYAENLFGSFVHYSSANRGDVAIYSNNVLRNVSLVNRDTAGHNESAFVCSAQSDSIIISNNIMWNDSENRPISNGFFGNSNSNDDNIAIVTSNFVSSAQVGIELNSTDNGSSGPVAEPGPIISNNVFYNVNRVVYNTGGFNASPYIDGEAYVGTRITGNIIVNGDVDLSGHVNCLFSNNYLRIDSLKKTSLSFSVNLVDSYNAEISNNIFYNDKWSHTPSDYTAIQYNHSGTLIDGTRYIAQSPVVIKNNTIQGYNKAIWDSNASNSATSISSLGVVISDNVLWQRDSSSAAGSFDKYLMIARPGTIVKNNILYLHPSGYGIKIRGVATGWENEINGPILFNNIIHGGSRSLEIGKANGEMHNIICVNNFYGAPVSDNTTDDPDSSGNIVTGNILFPVNENVPLDYLRIRRNMN